MATIRLDAKKCVACNFFVSENTNERCVFCDLWKNELRFSDTDAARATRLLADLCQARHPEQSDWRPWKTLAENLIVRHRSRDLDVLEWLTETLTQYFRCCLCDAHLPKNQKEPTCTKHKQWFKILEQKCRGRLPEGVSTSVIARDVAPVWLTIADRNPNTDDVTAWDLFMTESVNPRIDRAWGSTTTASNNGGSGKTMQSRSGAKHVVKPVVPPQPPEAVSLPTPQPAPPEPALLPVLSPAPVVAQVHVPVPPPTPLAPTPASPKPAAVAVETHPPKLPVLKRERTAAEGGWIRKYRDAITEQIGSPPTEHELNSMLAHREAWVFARTDKRGQSARNFYVAYLEQGLQEILQMIKAARGEKPVAPPELPRESPVTAPEPAPVPKPPDPPPAPVAAPEAAPPPKVDAEPEEIPPPVSSVPTMLADFEERLSVITARSILTRRVIAIALADLQELDRDLANLERDIERLKGGTATTPPTGVRA